MNKIFNWLFGACFRTLGRFLALILICLLLLFIGSKFDLKIPSFLMMNVNASTLTSYDTYAQYMNGSTSCGSSGKFSYALAGPSAREWESANIGSVVSGKAYAIDLSFNQTLLANTYYDITINFNSNDLRYNFTRNMLSIESGQSCQSYGTDNIAIVTFTNNATSSRNTNVLKLRIFNANAVNYFNINMDGGNQNITSVNNFGIKSVSITQVEDNSTEDIINNNNQNTEDIINNDNANTDRIEGAINEQLGNPCTNIFDFPFTSDNPFTITAPIDDYYVQTGYYIKPKPNTKYYYSFKSNKPGGTGNTDTVEVFILKDGHYADHIYLDNKQGSFTTFSGDYSYYFRFDCNKAGSTCTYYDFMISEETSNYCKYGTYVSKLDDVNDSLNDINSSITDNTSPDVSGLTNLAGYLPPGPLDSVLNLPLSILNSLNNKLSSSCTPLSLTLPFVNLPLSIPCLSTIFSQINGLNTLWESIGVILGALIMYKYLVYLYSWVDDVTSLRHTTPRLFGAKSDIDNWGGVE